MIFFNKQYKIADDACRQENAKAKEKLLIQKIFITVGLSPFA